ncbi:sodium-dependent multivitamin transporter-like [Pomacea canaliculata]|uniref:sodium-dependent multivitamin transporter-like n=1 Tax=Pomacea canaliculata TaxID=400727 RepID=UPI000D73B5CA|nr:sodium-dependent multivitamin transporter-like [Pomacea canaliculata]
MAAGKALLHFHWADYLVFSAVLVTSGVIGLYAAVRHRRATARQLLTGNKKLHVLPVTLSLAVSFISAVTILGVPTEAYFNSAEYWLVGISYVPAQLLTCLFFMPVFYSLELTSAYQYLEVRFNRTVRLMGSVTFTVEMILYMAVVMYAPALALSQVTQLSMEISILATGLLCTFYTAFGGIKAVVWTDALQAVVIVASMLTLITQGTVSVGGWPAVMQAARRGARFTWELDLDPDPFVRHTLWTLVVGGCLMSLSLYAANQAMLQRYLSVQSLAKARLTILLHLPVSEFFLALSMLTGLVMFAYYEGCDPLLQGKISKADQMVPLFVMQTLSFFPGLPGLFVACVYSAALSTVSSGVNSLAAVTLEDFVKPVLEKRQQGRPSERLMSIITVVSALLYGLLTIGLAYLAGVVGSTILQIVLSIFGMVGGPLLGVFVVGLFCPCVNSWGAGVGLVCSLATSLWVGIGAILTRQRTVSSLPPLNTLACHVADNVTNVTWSGLRELTTVYSVATDNVTSATPLSLSHGLDKWYQLSYWHYSTLSVIVSLIVAVVLSAMTGCNKKRDLDRRTYYDFFDWSRPALTKRSKCSAKETNQTMTEEMDTHM